MFGRVDVASSDEAETPGVWSQDMGLAMFFVLLVEPKQEGDEIAEGQEQGAFRRRGGRS